MYLTPKRVALGGGLLGLLILVTIVYANYNQELYVANLETRALNVGLVGTIDSLDPAMVMTDEERLITSAVYEGLVQYNEETIKPLIASQWRYSNDGKSLVINIKTGIKFHNGKRLTAKDIKKAWENNFSPNRDYEERNLLKSVVGSAEFLEGKTAEISGISVINDSTIKVSFQQPNAVFMHMLTNPIFWVYDCEDETTFKPGTGPFIIKESKENKEIYLKRNDKYHRGLPRVTAINCSVFRDANNAYEEYKAGRLDYLDTVPIAEIKEIKETEKYKKCLIQKPVLSIYAIGFKVNEKPFLGNYLLRRALNYAIDRKAIIENVMGDSYRAIKGPVPIGVAGYNREMPAYDYNPQKAADLLKEAGYPLGEGLPPLIMAYNKDEGHHMVFQSVAEQLAQLGVEIKLEPMDWDYYKGELRKMKLKCFRLGWKADYPDADNFLYSLFHSSQIGLTNFAGYNNQQVDKILNASREEVKSLQERLKLMNRAEEIIVDDAPYLWLFQKNATKLISEQVGSFHIDNLEMVDWYSIELLKAPPEGNKI